MPHTPSLLPSRRSLLRLGVSSGLYTGLALGAGALSFQAGASQSPPVEEPSAPKADRPPRPPRLDLDRVEEFVRAAHVDLEKTRELLAAEPGLVNATWDWGGGDWETALGGASHMGRPDIARVLLDHGARMDVFAAAMLGELDLVRAFLAADPEIIHLPGPHGIPLLAHAVSGEQDAVAALLRSHGA